MKPRSLFFGRIVLPAASIFVSLVHDASAVDRIKANNTSNFNAAAAWDTLPTTADIAVWNSTVTADNSIALGGNIAVGGLRIANPGGNVVINFTNAGHTLTLQGTGGIDMSSADAANLTLGSVLNQGFTRISTSGHSWNVAAGRTLTVNTKISETTNTKTLTLTGAGNIVINGDVSPAALLGLDITGANVTLSGTNTWRATNAGATSRFQISSGTLSLGNNNALGAHASGSTSFGINGGTLTASGAARSIVTNLGFSVGGNFAVADNASGAQALTFSSNVTLTGDRTITNNATTDTTFAGNFGLSNSSTARTLTIDGTGATVFSSVISNTGSVTSNNVVSTGTATTGNIIKNGSGTLVLGNANTFSGTLTINGSGGVGAVRLDHGSGARNSTVSVGIANGLTFGSGTTAATIGGLSGAGGLSLVNSATNAVALTVGNNNSNSSYSGALTGTGSLLKTGTGTLSLSGQSDHTGGTTISGGIVDMGSTGSVGGAITLTNGGGLRASTASTGNNIVLSGTNASATVYTNNASAGFNGAVSGSADQTLVIGGTTQVSFGASNSKQFQGFLGRVLIDSGASLRLAATSLNNGGDNTTFEVNGTLVTRNNGSVALGALTGSGFVREGTSGLNNQHAVFTIGAKNENANFSGSIQDGDTVNGKLARVIKTGTGIQTFSGTNSYTGSTTITGGTLALSGAATIASPTIIVGASTTFDVSAVTGGYTLASGQSLSGTGTVAGTMSVTGTLSPGNSPGTLNTGSQTWLDGGDYNWQILDATGVAGTGYDTIAVTGTLNLSSLAAGGFGINLWSLSSIGPEVSGNAINFNNLLTQSWTLLTTTGGITGFDAADFVLSVGANNGAAGFSNALDAGGSFSLGQTGNNLVLTYAVVPEPSAAMLVGGLGMLALLRRRRV